jgi:RNA polymerase sigma factor (sigma-70 family)
MCVAELSFAVGPLRRPRRHELTPVAAHLTDAALIEGVARSDQAALAELYDRYGGIAYGLALRVLRDPALAEDAVQEAFLHAWRSAQRFEAGLSQPSAWLLTLVHRRAVDIVRREQLRRTEPEESAPVPAGPGADEDAERHSKREIVQGALKRLPAEQREAIELAYYGGFTQTEVAERLGEPLGTIKSRMFTGLQRLRSLLDDAGFEPAGP